MKRTLLTILQYIIFLGLGVGIIVYMTYQLSDADKAEMIAAIRNVNLWYAIPIFIVGVLSHLFRALRWKLMLRPLDIRPSTMNTMLSVLIGYVANLVLPRAGEVAKCTVLARYERVPADKMVGTIVAERSFDVVCLGVITALAFALQANVIGNYASGLFAKMAGKGTLLIIAIVATAVLVLLLVYIYRRNKESKVGKFLKGMSDGIRSIFTMKQKWAFLVYTFLIWFMYLLQVYLGFLSLPATSHLSMLTALVVLIFGSVGMITTQGGIGAYTYLVANILLAYGIDNAHGQAFGWVSWAVQTGIVVILGVLALIVLPIFNRNRHATATAQDRLDQQ